MSKSETVKKTLIKGAFAKPVIKGFGVVTRKEDKDQLKSEDTPEKK